MEKKNFIITTDKETCEKLKASGFQLVQEDGNKWIFLNNTSLKFEQDDKIHRTNILNL